MIATLLRQLINIPGRLVHRAGQLTLRLPPGRELHAEILANLRDPDHPVHAVRPRSLGNHEPGATTGP